MEIYFAISAILKTPSHRYVSNNFDALPTEYKA